jgi:hypothetical protein
MTVGPSLSTLGALTLRAELERRTDCGLAPGNWRLRVELDRWAEGAFVREL